MRVFVDGFTRTDMLDCFVQSSLGRFHQFVSQRIRGLSSDDDGDGGISYSSVVRDSAIDLQHIAVLQHIIIRYAVDDAVIDREAEIAGIAVIAFEGAFQLMLLDIMFRNEFQFDQRYAGLRLAMEQTEKLREMLSRLPDIGYLLSVLYLDFILHSSAK